MSKIRALPDDLQKNAIEQLNEVPERVAEDIEALKTWIEKQPYLRARTNDQFLLAFLRGCKFSLEKAKSKIDKYYALRSKYPDFFTISNMEEEEIVAFLKAGAFTVLPIPLHENGPRILIARLSLLPIDKFMDFIRLSTAFQEITMMEDDYANINGIIHISDLSGMTAAHLLQMTPTIMKKLSVYSEEALPLRPKGMYCINTISLFHNFFKILTPLMPRKQQERLRVFGEDLSGLYEYIPQKYLPKEYGGENSSMEEMANVYIEKFKEYRDFFAEEKNYGTDEHLRPGGSLNYDDIFGVEGSFRKLNVD